MFRSRLRVLITLVRLANAAVFLVGAVLVCVACMTSELHAGEGKVWMPVPAAADAPVEAARVRIADFGADFLRGGDGQPRHHFHCHRYALVQDPETKLWRPNDRPVQLDLTVDVDGDGKTDDDVVGYHEFSLERPFNPVAPWYDTLAGTPCWHGGQAIYQANWRKTGFSEDGVNQDHDGPFCWPRENWAVFHETYEIYSPYRLAVNWLWLKKDFLNGGAANRVTFDDTSRLALVLKRYFMCIDSVRFLVRNGRQCYLSKATFHLVGTHTLQPAKTRWAKYNPQAPHDIYFDAESAEFTEHAFQDITAVGVYAAKDRFLPSYFGYKWYAFEADAVVHRRKRPSEIIAMVEVADKDGDDFYISKTEVPYELWKNVFRLARSNDFVPPSQGFGFEKDGDCGSMDFGNASHSLQEPATDFTLHDAAAWCNALSELTGRKPVYYADPGCEEAYKRAVKFRPIQFHFPEDYIARYGEPETTDTPSVGMGAGASHSLPGVYVADAMDRVLPPLYTDAQADGFRLPSVAEYQQAVIPDGQRYPWGNDAKGVFEHAWLFDNAGGTTHPVGRKKPTALGLCDVLGNVSALSRPGPQTRMRTSRLGGSILDLTVGVKQGLLSSDAPPTTWPYCDTGFRVVRQLPDKVSLCSESIHLVSVRRGASSILNIDPAKFDPLQGRVHRGNLHRDGVFQTTGLTKVKGVKWQFQTKGPIKSSPVVVDGMVYFGSNDNHIYAVDEEKGTEVWKVETRGAVAGSAAVVGGVVYIASEDGRMFALDARSGEKRWVTSLSRMRPCGSPAVAYGVAFIGEGARGGHEVGVMSAGPVVGLDAKTGEAVWQGPSGPQGYAAICLDATGLYAGTNGSSFAAIDLATAKSRWSRAGGHQNRQFMSFTRAGDLAYVPGSMTGTVMAWDPERGRTNWHEPIWPEQRLPINNGGTPGYEVYADLAVAHGRVYAASNDGALRTFDAITGKRGWTFEAGSPIQSSPSVADATVYFGCWNGNVYAVNALTGELRWKHKPSKLPAPDLTVGGNEPSARIISSPWPGDNVIYVDCDDGCLYALH